MALQSFFFRNVIEHVNSEDVLRKVTIRNRHEISGTYTRKEVHDNLTLTGHTKRKEKQGETK